MCIYIYIYIYRLCNSFPLPVPAPRGFIVRTPSTGLYTTTRLNLTCITVLNPAVDTPMTVIHTWQGPSGSISHYSSHPSVYSVVRVGQEYRSTILFSSGLQSSDSGTYLCISFTSSSPYIVPSGSTQVSTHIYVGKRTEIAAVYINMFH